jgi:hypothetical protein
MPSRLHHNSCTEQDFLKVAFVRASSETFVLDPDLQSGFVFQHAQRGAAEDAETTCRVCSGSIVGGSVGA